MKKIILLVVFSGLALSGCGKKASPMPKSTLNIPVPDGIEIVLGEEGVEITNPSGNYAVIAERAVSEIGDLSLPRYSTIAYIEPGGTVIDNTTEQDVRYLYRFRSVHNRYDAYSDAITRVVSYRGRVAIESFTWRITGEQICIDMDLTRSVSYVDILLNGENMGRYNTQAPCYPLPPLAGILIAALPFSESGVPGRAHSVTIERDVETTLLPPQNIRDIRREDQLTLSWEAMPQATEYRIYFRENGNVLRIARTDATLYTVTAPLNQCATFGITTVSGERESDIYFVESCP